MILKTDRFKISKLFMPFNAAVLIFVFGFFAPVFAQDEDTTRVRQIPELPETNRYNNFINTPYQSPLSPGDMERYNFNGVEGSYLFHRRLRYMSAEDFLFSEEDRYDPYGMEWEKGLNANLMTVLHATFKEQNRALQRLARILPFLGFGFFEPYEVPVVPRMNDNPIPQPGFDQD